MIEHSLKLWALPAAAASIAASGAAAWWPEAMFGVPLAVALAGFAGALIALSFQEGHSLARMAGSVASGTLIATYTTPLASHYAELPANLGLGLAFVLGLTAQVLIPMGLRAAPDLLKAAIKRLGGSP